MEKKKVIILPTNPSKIGGRGANFLTELNINHLFFLYPLPLLGETFKYYNNIIIT